MTDGCDLSQMFVCTVCLSVCLFQMYVCLSSGVCHWLLRTSVRGEKKRYLVGCHQNEIVRRIGDDVAFGGRIVSNSAGRVTEPTETEAQDAVRS